MWSGVDTIARPLAVVIAIPSRLDDSWTRVTRDAPKLPLPRQESTSSPARTSSIGFLEPSAIVTIVPATRH
jgi:hypothetical protein